MLELDGYVTKSRIQISHRSEVWLGVRTADGCPMVLKRYRGPDGDAEAVNREFRTLLELAGPGIPRAVEVTHAEDGTAWLVQEKTPGVPLHVMARSRPLAIGTWLKVAFVLAQVLARVHRARLVHRDLHPRNVLVEPETLAVHLIDLGAARKMGTNLRTHSMSSTGTGRIGVLAYVSPEQTGRMDRGVDFRSDLYSLGATLYDALTGRPPFSTTDPLALIHAHMARRPAGANELRKDVPPTLSRILLKLLEKEPDERYQSADALAEDLKECIRQFERTGSVSNDLRLGRFDAESRIRFSSRLHGRENELARLESAYQRARSGRLQVVLLTGPSGIGKSALVNQLRGCAAQTSGNLAAGTAHPAESSPYQPWCAALESWVDQVLAEREDRHTFWKSRLRSNLHHIAAALIPLVPSLSYIMGDVPPLPELGPKETRDRLAHCVQCFLIAAATRDHPLILVLEDLHWADAASVKLLETLVSPARDCPVLIVGTLRTRPGAEDDYSPLAEEQLGVKEIRSLLECVQTETEHAFEMQLEPIDQSGIESLLAEALAMPAEDAARLTRHVIMRTGSDLASIRQYVQFMHDKRWLRRTEEGWAWDEPMDAVEHAPESILSILVSQLEHLPAMQRTAIERASYAGTEFDVELVQDLFNATREDLEASLIALAERGLLRTSRHGFRFTHDRIREAAQAKAGAEERARVHSQITRYLIGKLSPEERAARIFEVTDHANASDLVCEDSHRALVIELNRSAGQRALQSGDGSTAHRYLVHARSHLRESDWNECPRLCIDLALECAESAFHCDDMEAARQAIERIDERSLDREDFARLAQIRAQILLAQESLQECVRYALGALRKLGLHWPEHPGPMRMLWAVLTTRWCLRGISELGTPQSDPEPGRRRPITQLLLGTGGAIARTNVPLLVLSLCWNVRTTLRYGYMHGSALALASYAAFIARPWQGARYADRLAQTALSWQGCSDLPVDHARTQLVVQGILRPFALPRRAALKPLPSIATVLRENGDPELALYASVLCITPSALAGDPIPEVLSQLERLKSLGRRHQEPDLISRHLQLLRSSDEPSSGQNPVEETIAHLREISRFHPDLDQGCVVTFLMMALCVRGQFAAALSESERIWSRISKEPFVWLVDHTFYRGLAAAAYSSEGWGRDQRRAHRIAHSCRARLARWAKEGPDFVHMHQIVSAELSCANGKSRAGQQLLRRAATRAQQQEYTNHAALAFDRLAQHLDRVGRRFEAATACREAHECYAAWGATDRCAEVKAQARELASGTNERPLW